jgi:hypothetical protein
MIKLFDYRAWVHRAHQFVVARHGRPGFTVAATRVDPPLERRRVDALARRLDERDLQLPNTLRLFLTFGAAALDCRYMFEHDPADRPADDAIENLFVLAGHVSGGACLGPAHELPAFAESCASRAEVILREQDTDRADEWSESLPLIAVSHGDYIALDMATALEPDDPPVIYLSHDRENIHLADSFTDFLTTWERLCYIGPEIRMFDRFFGGDGLLDPRSPAVDQLRSLLGAPNDAA